MNACQFLETRFLSLKPFGQIASYLIQITFTSQLIDFAIIIFFVLLAYKLFMQNQEIKESFFASLDM